MAGSKRFVMLVQQSYGSVEFDQQIDIAAVLGLIPRYRPKQS